MANRPRKGTPPESEGSSPAAAGDELPERWSAQRKMELVLRLLRGELARNGAPARRRKSS
jgi:hypothetical protein